MMISPESYYELNLKGKTAEQIMRTIRGLKNEIGHLKNVMEHPDYGSEAIMYPSESTRLWYMRKYLQQAKIALVEAGGTYSPSQSELKAIAFNSNISAISKILFYIGGFLGGHETRLITINGGDLRVSVYHSLSINPKRIAAEFLLPYGKDEF